MTNHLPAHITCGGFLVPGNEQRPHGASLPLGHNCPPLRSPADTVVVITPEVRSRPPASSSSCVFRWSVNNDRCITAPFCSRVGLPLRLLQGSAAFTVHGAIFPSLPPKENSHIAKAANKLLIFFYILPYLLRRERAGLYHLR